MFVKNAKKSFLDLTLSEVSTLIGLLQERQQSIYYDLKDLPIEELDQDLVSELNEYLVIESKLFKLRNTFD